METKMQKSRMLLLMAIVVVTALTRLLPHPPNFSPVMAVSLFSGAYFMDKKYAILVPILAMFLSDIVIGFHDLMPVVYILMVAAVLLGTKLRNSFTFGRIFGYSVLGSVLFFMGTNLGVWATSGMYTKDLSGLALCFTAAVPFFQSSLAGDLLFTGVLFGLVYALERMSVVPQEVRVRA
jgi:hypothetical protein